MRAFPQMQTQAIKIKCKIATEFPLLSAQPPLSLVQSQALGNSDTTYNPGTRKKTEMRRVVMFQTYYQDRVGEMFVYRDSHRGAVTREG